MEGRRLRRQINGDVDRGNRDLWSVRQRGSEAEEEGEIEEFFGQLWQVPVSYRESRVTQRDRLFWVRRDLWESREFGKGDCYPVAAGDKLSESR